MQRLAWILLAAVAIHATQQSGLPSDTEDVDAIPAVDSPSGVAADLLASAERLSEANAILSAPDVLPLTVDGRTAESAEADPVTDAVLSVVEALDSSDGQAVIQANDTFGAGDEIVPIASATNETAASSVEAAAPPPAGRKRVNCSSLSLSVPHRGRSAESVELQTNASADSTPQPYATTELPEQSELPSSSSGSSEPKTIPVGIAQSGLLIINNTQLTIAFKSTAADVCTLLILYAPWCPFSARFAPHLNAAARAFPDLRLLAVNGATLNSLNSKYATVAVPNVILLHGQGKFVARFNYTEKSLQSLIWFVQNITNLTAANDANVTAADYYGPLAAQPVGEPDYYLHAALGALIFAALYCLAISGLVAKMFNWLRPPTQQQQQEQLRHEHVD